MKRTSKLRLLLLSLALILALSGCALPSVTPPATYGETELPTITAPIPATAEPATPTPQPVVEVIGKDNVAKLKAVKIVPATNVQSITWSADSSMLSLITENSDANGNTIYNAALLDAATLSLQNLWSADSTIAALAPDGHTAAVISKDGTTLTLFDLSNGTSKPVAMVTPGYLINNVTFSPDGQYFSIASGETWSVTIYHLDGTEVKTLTGFGTAAPVYDAGFYGNSSLILWHARAIADLQDLESGAMGSEARSEDFLSAYEISPNSQLLATSAGKTFNGNFTPAVTLWEVTTGNALGDLVLEQTANGLSFSPDSSLLAVTSGNEVQVWDVASLTKLVSLSGHSDMAARVAFSPDGKSLVSSGADNQLILWQVVQ